MQCILVDPAHFVSSHKTPQVFFPYRFRGSKRPDVCTDLAANCGLNSVVVYLLFTWNLLKRLTLSTISEVILILDSKVDIYLE